jgi:hypothetical protein
MKEPTMTTLIETYPDEATARKAVNALRAAGIPERRIRLLIGGRLRDTRNEPAGGFARPIAPGAPVGTFGNTPALRCDGNGSFAGDADRQRRGSYADAYRDVVVDFDHGCEHACAVADGEVRTCLQGAGISDGRAELVIAQLRNGDTALLAEIPDITPHQARGDVRPAA